MPNCQLPMINPKSAGKEIPKKQEEFGSFEIPWKGLGMPDQIPAASNITSAFNTRFMAAMAAAAFTKMPFSFQPKFPSIPLPEQLRSGETHSPLPSHSIAQTPLSAPMNFGLPVSEFPSADSIVRGLSIPPPDNLVAFKSAVEGILPSKFSPGENEML